MDARRALVLLDGLDEAGRERARIEAHVTTVLAPRKLVLLCTSRPTGLDEALFQGFHRLKLAPLSDAQQAAFLATRLTPTRAGALVPYLRDRVPLDAETRLRVTCNPLMLSMVTSIAELRADLAMPTRTAELYDVATRAMLARGGVLPEADMALLSKFSPKIVEILMVAGSFVGYPLSPSGLVKPDARMWTVLNTFDVFFVVGAQPGGFLERLG
jgi:hypothetical protein